MKRRHFMAASVAAGAGLLSFRTGYAQSKCDYYELRHYILENESQEIASDRFMQGAAVPAYNRLGFEQVGVFKPRNESHDRYILLRHTGPQTVVRWQQELLKDEKYLKDGAEFLSAPATNPNYSRIQSSLLIAFTGMPHMELPVTDSERVFQLRIYESPSVKTGQKKIEMFNTAEIAIFRKTGLNPVFFGETLIGDKMPNLTYMLGFSSEEEQQASWKRFGAHPEWQKLRAIPEYADDKILSGITNINLYPTEYSQV